MVIIESKQCTVAAESAYMVPANVLSEITVEGLLGIIVNHKHDNYTLTTIGEGCRYWPPIISKDLVEEGVIPEEVSDIVINALEMYWPSS